MQEPVQNYCPYCNEPIQLLVDGSVEEQRYIEDCQVCCRPIVVTAYVDTDGDATVVLKTEDE